jgi:hypothetical protein
MIHVPFPLCPSSNLISLLLHLLRPGAPLESRLLPHLDALNLHLPAIFPRRIPRIPRVPEIPLSRGTSIHPRLTRVPIRPPPICAAHSHVQNKIEFLIKRRRRTPSLTPRIHNPRPVLRRSRKVPLRPQWAIKRYIQRFKKARVHVREEILGAPLEPERVVLGGVGRVQRVLLRERVVPGVLVGSGTPMEGAGGDVVAARGIGEVVTAGLRDVDFAGGGPVAVRGLYG